jgi:LPXTG-motif cell wall-anchored protein
MHFMRRVRPVGGSLTTLVLLTLTVLAVTATVAGAATTTTGGTTSTSTSLPLAVPVVHVTPSQGVRDRQIVVVNGSGFTPGVTVSLKQCTLSRPSRCNLPTDRDAIADSSGRFAVSMVVRRWIPAQPDGADCAFIGCGIIARQILQQPVYDLVEFDPSIPATPGPALLHRPYSPIHDGDAVAIQGIGFTGNAKIAIAECPDAEVLPLTECDPATRFFVQSDASGNFVTSIVVHAAITTGGPNRHVVDCRVGGCFVAAANVRGTFDRADFPIGFGAAFSYSPLPRTGSDVLIMVLLGAALLLLGAALVAACHGRGSAAPLWPPRVSEAIR